MTDLEDFCGSSGCAEVLPLPDGVLLRSSRRPDETTKLDGDEWGPFIADVKAGRYDYTVLQGTA